ncbi:MAG: AAA family ATPase [Actinobacteria bacterium]|nr:AAA family ATPase [Actinomycetota bacterium]
MKRTIMDDLIKWKSSPGRKPLVLKGARQVGKTYILEKFGQEYFKKYHYIDLRENKNIGNIFKDTYNPREIIRQLEFVLRIQINITSDLLIFDEIQDCKGAITSLKYFQKDMSGLALIAAGSHLGMTKNEESFPVGKVNFLYMFPMNFEEFLLAADEQTYKQYKNFNIDNPFVLPEVIHNRLLEMMRYYFVTGGLPEVVGKFVSLIKEDEREALNVVRERQKELVEGYNADFSKYSGTVNANHIHNVFESIPAQLSKAFDEEVPKYIFKGVIPNQKGYERISGPLGWLVKGRLCIKSLIASKAEHPLRSYCQENKFKAYLFDMGILNCMLNTPPEAILAESLGSYKGFLAENFVAQELYSYLNTELIAWSEGRSEIEFLISKNEHIIPIEVKSSNRSRKSKSLDVFVSKYKPERAYKLSNQNFGKQEKKKIITLPIYFCGKLV